MNKLVLLPIKELLKKAIIFYDFVCFQRQHSQKRDKFEIKKIGKNGRARNIILLSF